MAAVANVAADVEIDSALTLLEPPELEFYRAHGRSLRGGASGTLADR